MKPFPPLVYFGSDDFSAAMLLELLTHEDFKSSLKYVVTKTPRVLGRGQKTQPTAVEIVVKEHTDAALVHADSKLDLERTLSLPNLTDQAAMGVLVSYGVIIPQSVLDLFPLGIINFHPSHLPLYRGPSPVETAMLRGDNTLGLSVMKLTSAMDAGPIYMQAALAIRGSETRREMYERIVSEGAHIFYATLRKIADGGLRPVEQDDERATYTRLIKKQDGELRPDIKTAAELEREVRTYLAFPKSRTTLHGQPVIVTRSRVVESATAAPLVLTCAGPSYLAIEELVAPSGRTMSGEAFLRGYAA